MRGDEAVNPEVITEFARLSQENRELRAKAEGSTESSRA